MASSDGGRGRNGPGDDEVRLDEVRLWYEDVLGWPTVPAEPGLPGLPGQLVRPVRLAVGVRFDVLDVPAEAGAAALARLEGGGRRGGRPVGFPVALCGGRMLLLVAAGSAAELPGLLEWLEWGAPLELDLTAVGAGGVMEAPLPLPAGSGAGAGAREVGASAREVGAGAPDVGAGAWAGAGGPVGAGAARGGSQGAAVWLRPPGPERGAEASLPTLSAMGARDALGDCDSPPDLARVVNTVATQVHRVRLRRARAAAAVRADAQPLAFS
ncbi:MULTISPECIES: SCO3374 family protein [unclassified Streptomyces]|uniref:SCO3374 family protein n=1 Tax=unclassified Streptomyces TaxID=2593676 RepID=UPI001C8E28BA|nr:MULTISPECIES: SCO3374 family protein [unclassified Streptomyces]